MCYTDNIPYNRVLKEFLDWKAPICGKVGLTNTYSSINSKGTLVLHGPGKPYVYGQISQHLPITWFLVELHSAEGVALQRYFDIAGEA